MAYNFENENKLLNKINALENKILEFLKVKLKVNLTGKEINLDLSNKNIGNIELNLLSSIKFDKLENFNLSHNNISDIYIFKEFHFKKLKKLDLSFNKINNIKEPHFSYNSLNDIRNSLLEKNNKKERNILINLSNNDLLEKDMEEVKNIIINNLSYKEYNNTKDDLINKVNKLEKKILQYFNSKLNINLTRKEIKLNLNNKNIGNAELSLLNGVDFKNLKEINLSHNIISDIESLKDFKNLKKINLSFNNINNITPLKEISENNKNIESINLNNNNIIIVDILKQKIFPNIIEINLDNNNIIKKDIEEIRKIIENGRMKKNDMLNSIKENTTLNLKNEENSNPGMNKIKIGYKIGRKNKRVTLFGKTFVENNIENCRITIKGKEQKIEESIFFNENGEITIQLNEIKKIKNISYMFYGCTSLISLPDISNWNMDDVTDITGMFASCTSLSLLSDISNWNTSSITDMSILFAQCSSLTSIPDISKWDTSNVKKMTTMFAGCSKLSTLPDISKWNMSNVVDISSMLSGCSSLLLLPEISLWNTSNVINMNYLFSNCSSLSSFPDISNWDINKVTSKINMFDGINKNIKIPEKFK